MLGGGGVDGGEYDMLLPRASPHTQARCIAPLTDGILSHNLYGIRNMCAFALHPLLTAIHRAAGPELYEECLTVPQVERNVRCPTGEARITK